MVWILLAPVLVGIAGYTWYVTLIRRRNQAREALASVDVQLQKRHDLIPNILLLARKFMAHEAALLEQITALRARVTRSYDPGDPAQVREHLEAAGGLESSLQRLFAVSEAYPSMRSSETVLEAQQTYAEVEGHIAAARRFYNSAVSDLRNAMEIFPGSWIAGLAQVESMPFYEVPDRAAHQAVDVNAHL